MICNASSAMFRAAHEGPADGVELETAQPQTASDSETSPREHVIAQPLSSNTLSTINKQLAASDNPGGTMDKLEEVDSAKDAMLSPHHKCPNPRRLPLPEAAELPAGTGKGGFFGVAYRDNRKNSPWLARYNGCTIGSYATAYEAALARFICSKYDRDVVLRNGMWYGSAYITKDGALSITRFKGSTEHSAMDQIDVFLQVGGDTADAAADKSDDQPSAKTASVPPANPRRCRLPTELPQTSGRGGYRGVVKSGDGYTARRQGVYLSSYNTAFQAALACYIAEHYDRDIEQDDTHGYVARAYKKGGGGTITHIQRFHAETEAEAVRLVDQCHGIARTEGAKTALQQLETSSPLTLRGAILQYIHEMWARCSVRDGYSVCEELYLCWHYFLARRGLSQFVRIKTKRWQEAMEEVLNHSVVKAPIEEDEQAMTLPAECRLPVRTGRGAKGWHLQWEMVMTAVCGPDTCVAAWERRRLVAARQSIYRRQATLRDEVRGRELLRALFPDWKDEWKAPTLLDSTEVDKMAKEEVQRMSLERLTFLARQEPENRAAQRELKKREAMASV